MFAKITRVIHPFRDVYSVYNKHKCLLGGTPVVQDYCHAFVNFCLLMN